MPSRIRGLTVADSLLQGCSAILCVGQPLENAKLDAAALIGRA